MEHEEEKGKLKEIKWQRGKGVGMEKKSQKKKRERKGNKENE